MTNYYTGIGSRETPNEILDRMTRLGSWFSELDWVLRSGGAEGADRAFERGVRVGTVSYTHLTLPTSPKV